MIHTARTDEYKEQELLYFSFIKSSITRCHIFDNAFFSLLLRRLRRREGKRCLWGHPTPRKGACRPFEPCSCHRSLHPTKGLAAPLEFCSCHRSLHPAKGLAAPLNPAKTSFWTLTTSKRYTTVPYSMIIGTNVCIEKDGTLV